MGIRDLAMLESAVFRPQSSFGGKDLYETILAKASALMHSIILNHPFVDGNKRTSVVVLGRFLYLNGYRLHVQNKELVLITQQVGVKELGLEGLTKWLEIHCSKS
jgi:death-on-curing protein